MWNSVYCLGSESILWHFCCFLISDFFRYKSVTHSLTIPCCCWVFTNVLIKVSVVCVYKDRALFNLCSSGDFSKNPRFTPSPLLWKKSLKLEKIWMIQPTQTRWFESNKNLATSCQIENLIQLDYIIAVLLWLQLWYDIIKILSKIHQDMFWKFSYKAQKAYKSITNHFKNIWTLR